MKPPGQARPGRGTRPPGAVWFLWRAGMAGGMEAPERAGEVGTRELSGKQGRRSPAQVGSRGRGPGPGGKRLGLPGGDKHPGTGSEQEGCCPYIHRVCLPLGSKNLWTWRRGRGPCIPCLLSWDTCLCPIGFKRVVLLLDFWDFGCLQCVWSMFLTFSELLFATSWEVGAERAGWVAGTPHSFGDLG